MDFKEFKKQQKALSASVNKMAQEPTHNVDERFWTLTKDATGNASATIRFLPQQDPNISPLQLTYYHNFKTEGRTFNEQCPFTIKGKGSCPVCNYSSDIDWKASKADKEEGGKHWRSKAFYSNILVIKDEAKPENEGKVFLYKFGPSIHKIITNRVNPKVEKDDDPEDVVKGVNVFDLDTGLNFKLRMIQKSGHNNYDEKSKFVMTGSPVGDGDDKLQEEIYKAIRPYNEFYDEKVYKSFEELQKKLSSVQGATDVPNIQEELNKLKKQETESRKKIEDDNSDDSTDSTDDDIDDDIVDDEDIDFDALLLDDD